jgi:hypothetical protein
LYFAPCSPPFTKETPVEAAHTLPLYKKLPLGEFCSRKYGQLPIHTQPKTIQKMKINPMTACLAAALAVAGTSASAQILVDTDPIHVPVDGYVVTLKGDTLRGKVAVIGVNNYVTLISFRPAKGAEKVKYGPDDLLAFSQKRPDLLRDFTDLTSVDKEQVHYESKEHPRREGRKVFMERLMDGRKIRVYNNPAGGEKSTSVAGFKLSEKETSYVVQKTGARPFILKKNNYEEEFDTLFGDCAEFAAYAKGQPDFRKFRQLGLVVEQYNTKCE